MNEEILGLLGLPAEEIARYRQQATMSGLGALGQALIQAGAPRQGTRQGTLAGIAQALPAYGAGRQASMDQVLQDLLRRQQVQQMVAQQQAKQQAQQRQETALARLRSITQPVTPESALGMPGRVGPTADRAAMIGQRPQMTRDLALQLGLDPDLPEPLRKSLFDYAQATKPEEAKLPTSAQEFELAKTNPAYAAFLRQKAESGATKVSIKMNETFGGTLNQNLEGYFNNGSQARSFLPTVQTMSALLDEGVRTGFGQETMNKFNQAAQLFNPGYKAKQVAGQEAFIALGNEIILPQVKQLGVNPTDADLNFIVKGSPTLSKSVEGNRLLLNTLNIKLQRDALLQEFVTNWQDQNVSLIENSPVRANSKLRSEILNLTKTHPLWTEATQRLRQQYSQITSGSAGSLTAGSPFSRK